MLYYVNLPLKMPPPNILGDYYNQYGVQFIETTRYERKYAEDRDEVYRGPDSCMVVGMWNNIADYLAHSCPLVEDMDDFQEYINNAQFIY